MAGDPRALLQKVRNAPPTNPPPPPSSNKALSSASGGFSFFGGREEKYMGAADLYIEAANAFRVQKMNREAGQAFEKASQVQINNLKEPDDAANTLVDAFKVYKQESPEDAVRCLDFSIQQYCKKGNFRRAAQHKENLAEVLETQIGDTKRALEAYELAATWYESDNASALANKLWLKVADVAALEGDYYKAVGNYEKVATASVNNNLMRYSVKDYFLKAGICHLATQDTVATDRALEKYRDMDPTFTQTREHQLLVDLTEAVKAGNQEEFTDRLFQYDQMSKLDKWKTEILVRVKSMIVAEEEDFS
ncbi:putative Vesicular-fusion protein sec17 [Seiridium cardinale]|uniref:Vesicular-fusion protein sec17 n=1 Tax=Seiridium cardinale TaxID=138064 RepID=A0ABR2XS46_9PEZI